MGLTESNNGNCHYSLTLLELECVDPWEQTGFILDNPAITIEKKPYIVDPDDDRIVTT